MERYKILIVEDEITIVKVLAKQFSRLEHTILGLADRGGEVIAIALLKLPDLVLMDSVIKDL